MNTDFKDVISKRTDEELIKIVTVDRDGYQPLAVEAAEQEIKNRNIDTTKIEQVKADLATKIEEQKEFDSKKVSSLTRFIHLIVDTIAFIIVMLILGFILGLFINLTNQSSIAILRYLLLTVSFFWLLCFYGNKVSKNNWKVYYQNKSCK